MHKCSNALVLGQQCKWCVITYLIRIGDWPGAFRWLFRQIEFLKKDIAGETSFRYKYKLNDGAAVGAIWISKVVVAMSRSIIIRIRRDDRISRGDSC